MHQSILYLVRFVLVALVAMCFPVVAGAKPYKSAEIFTHDSQLYGKYVIRIQAAKGSGVISNFFLWKDGSELPDVSWEEVDIEVFGKDNAQSWQSNIITGLGSRIRSEEEHDANFSFGDAYHTFTLEWTAGSVRWLVDGELVRAVKGSQAGDLINPSQMRFNFWPPNIPDWVGLWDDSILPVYMFVNWVEYHSWTDEGFRLSWRDDFNTFDSNRWGKADWTFIDNRADFAPANVVIKDGYLVLAMTHEGREGYTGTPPSDSSGSSSWVSGSSNSSSSSSSSSSGSSSSSSSSGSEARGPGLTFAF